MSDIVERLRARRCPPVMANKCGLSECTCKVQEEAAAEIARLRAEVAALRAQVTRLNLEKLALLDAEEVCDGAGLGERGA